MSKVSTKKSSDLVYEPFGAAAELFGCRDPEILIEGPAGTGKTRAILTKVVLLADKYPQSRHLICRKTRTSMTESVLVTLEKKVFPPGHPVAQGQQRSHRQRYAFGNGSEIVVGGLDSPERLYSTEYDTVTVFEATEATEDDWENLHRALRNGKMPYHQAIGDCNPGPPHHWLNQRANTPIMTRLLSRHEDNPLLWDRQAGCWTPAGQQYIDRLDGLTGHRRMRLRFGRWTAAEGVVYDGWDSAVHVVDRFQVPRDWPRYWVIDFGYTDPFTWQAWTKDRDGRLIMYREIYMTHKLVEDHAREILKAVGAISEGQHRVKWPSDAEPRPVAIICDHDAEGRAVLERYLGMPTVGAKKDIQVGIQRVAARLRKAGDGKPRLMVMRDSLVKRDPELVEAKRPTCFQDEIDGYVWDLGNNRKHGEVPVDKDNHGMDCGRYIVAHFDHQGGSRTMRSKPSAINGGAPRPSMGY